MNTYIKKQFDLSLEGIDEAADFLTEELEKFKMPHKDILRLRLSVEEILFLWHQSDKTENTLSAEVTKRFGRVNITVSCAGQPLNPMLKTDDEYGDNLLGRSLLENLGLSPSWTYHDGVNEVSASYKLSKPKSQSIQVVIAIFTAIVMGIIFGFLPENVCSGLTSGLLDPLFNTFLSLLSCIVGPMMFLSVAWGIYNIGDARRLGIIGKKLLFRFLTVALAVGVVSMLAALCVWGVKPTSASSGENVFQSLCGMIFAIIPKNIVSPFAEGNTLQILFMGAAVGFAMIMLQSKVPVIAKLLEQANTMVQYMLSGISMLIPGFVFLSLFRLILAGTLKNSIGGLMSAVLLIVGIIAVQLLVEGLWLSRLGVKPKSVLKKIAPVFFVALSTASSAAAYPQMMDCCENKMGINKKLSDFAIPFGSVVFMPNVVNAMSVLTVFCAQYYGVALSVESIIMCIFTAVVLSVAAPPIPGGALTCYTLVFSQMGIPLEALSLTAAIDILLDFPATTGNICSLIFNLTHTAKKLNMIDEKTLHNK